MGKTVFYARDGSPLLWYEDEAPPYRRTTAGFRPPQESPNDAPRPVVPAEPVEASCSCQCPDDAEALTLDPEEKQVAEPEIGETI